MNININNPEEDQYGNSKDNIFIAFGEQGNYLGSAFTYPAINHHQTPDTPYLIYLSVDTEGHLEESLNNLVRQQLFDKVLSRAKTLRMQRPDLTARIYAGFQSDQETMGFYLGNGFEANHSMVMEACIQDNFAYTLPEDMEAAAVGLNSDKELMDYKERYDEIFVTPLDLETLAEQGRQPHFHNLSFIKNGKLQGGCTFFATEGCGYIETVYVVPEARGTGISKVIMNYIFDYFLANGLSTTRLEVWELNTRAVRLYASLGFAETQKQTMFPGITL